MQRVMSVFVAAAGIASAAVIVNNPSFETPVVSPYSYNTSGGSWTFNGNTGIWNVAAFGESGSNGAQAGFIQQCNGVGCAQNDPTPPGLSSFFQSLTGFTVGNSYTISFLLASRPGTLFEDVTVTV